MLHYRIPVDDIPLPAGLRPAGSGGCRIPRRVLLLIALGALLGASAALAQTGGGFDLTWNTVDGGGGTSVGGNVSLTGSIGQPDASAPLSGGGYTLVGGFWGEIRVSRPVYLPLVLR